MPVRPRYTVNFPDCQPEVAGSFLGEPAKCPVCLTGSTYNSGARHMDNPTLQERLEFIQREVQSTLQYVKEVMDAPDSPHFVSDVIRGLTFHKQAVEIQREQVLELCETVEVATDHAELIANIDKSLDEIRTMAAEFAKNRPELATRLAPLMD